MIAFIKEPREVWGIERPAVFYRSPPRRSTRTWPLRMIRTKHRIVPFDRVNRQFRATMPNQLWVSDFTYVSTWQGFVYVAFVIDTFANKIVG